MSEELQDSIRNALAVVLSSIAMVNRNKINSNPLRSSIKTVFGFIMFILIFSTCKKATIANDLANTGSSQDSLSIRNVDSIPASITIDYGDNLIGIRGYVLYGSPTVLVKNKAGNPLKGIPLSFTPCTGCGTVNWVFEIACPGCTPVPVDTIFYTNSDGKASANWVLGTLSDSIQTLTAKVRDSSNLSVTFKAITRYYKLHNYIGTINIVAPGDSSGVAAPFLLPYNGITPYQVNTNMPLEMDSMSLVVNHYVISPQTIIINGDTVMRYGKTTLGCCDFYSGINYQSGGTNYDYLLQWFFTGAGTNNVFSGTYQNVVDYFVTPPPPNDVLRGGYTFGGAFSVTQQ